MSARPVRRDALLGAAPALLLAFLAIALRPGIVTALALLPGLALAWRDARRARLERDSLVRVAARIDRLEPGVDPPKDFAPASERATASWNAALARLQRARELLRTQEAAQKRSVRDDQVRARFTAAMGHELRSPLNSIVGFAQLLESGSDGPLTPGQLESVVRIRRAAEDLLRLLTDVLDSARLDAGKLSLSLAWTPSVELVTDSVSQGRSIVEGRGVRIDAYLQPGLPPVFVDRPRVVQAVLATFRHAVRGKEGGEIEVRAVVGDMPDGRRAVRVEVRDPGRALTAEALARVFESFGDLRASTGRRIEGLGLALSLSRQLVRLHDGDVWAESDPRQGTRYVVALPVRR